MQESFFAVCREHVLILTFAGFKGWLIKNLNYNLLSVAARLKLFTDITDGN